MAKGLLARAILGGVPWGGEMVRWGWAVRGRGGLVSALAFFVAAARRAACAPGLLCWGSGFVWLCVLVVSRALFGVGPRSMFAWIPIFSGPAWPNA